MPPEPRLGDIVVFPNLTDTQGNPRHGTIADRDAISTSFGVNVSFDTHVRRVDVFRTELRFDRAIGKKGFYTWTAR